ncbi:LacI family DNA-binding transcriptional regulator [Dryocola sp. BD586]|uniref:LacI family DNA-binding transcriptional regulator n=1 Tax=Dryocola sp. BD586 TaxID=3133271 RepID=UPI003F50C025
MTERAPRPVTSYDVAKHAGVSQSAVSRAFTEGGKVSDATRKKIHQAAEELGYRPSFVARSLITRRSNQIGVVVPGLVNPFYSELLDRLTQACKQIGYQVLLFSTFRDNDTDPVLEEVLRHRVEALILVSASLSSRFAQECARSGLPVVLLNRKNEAPSVSSVTSDNQAGGEKIADFLLAGGHQRIAFMAGRESSSTSRDRELGFVNRIRSQGGNEPLRIQGNYTLPESMAATRALLDSPAPPDALFCANDLMAIAALNVAAGERGMIPGQDISIVGFDNIAMAAWPLFDLTTYEQPLDAMVATAMDILQGNLAGAQTPVSNRVLEGRLIIRGSARKP